MTFDTQTMLIVGGAVLAVIILVWLVLRLARRRQSIESKLRARIGDATDPYAVDRARPYHKAGEQPETEPPLDISQPAIPLPGDFAGIAFPPHSTDHPDELTRLKGVGPKLETLLNEQGVTRYEQLASLDEAGLVALDDRLGAFKGRLARDRVAEQARLLASGDTRAFEEKFGKLGG
jgi:predicted flap endonuclease-1-like 5' DNA nuclease